jgi:hypothetical protein
MGAALSRPAPASPATRRRHRPPPAPQVLYQEIDYINEGRNADRFRWALWARAGPCRRAWGSQQRRRQHLQLQCGHHAASSSAGGGQGSWVVGPSRPPSQPSPPDPPPPLFPPPHTQAQLPRRGLGAHAGGVLAVLLPARDDDAVPARRQDHRRGAAHSGGRAAGAGGPARHRGLPHPGGRAALPWAAGAGRLELPARLGLCVLRGQLLRAPPRALSPTPGNPPYPTSARCCATASSTQIPTQATWRWVRQAGLAHRRLGHF